MVVLGNPLAYWLLTPLVVMVSNRAAQSAERGKALALHLAALTGFLLLHPWLRCMFIPFPNLDGFLPVSWKAYERAATWNLWNSASIYAVIAGLSTAYTYHAEAKRRTMSQAALSASLAESRLQLLKSQLHPHFLFNILHDISGLMTLDPPAARRMMGRLQDLLHVVVEEQTENLIPLSRELDFLRCYLELEKMRLGERLSVSFEVDGETLEAMVPNMVLQPVVENSIKHGIARFNRAGRLRIASRREGSLLRLVVEDNGPGLEAEARHGVGLSNIEARLSHHFHEKQSIRYANLPARGLRCEIVVPFTPQSESAETEVMNR